MKKIILITLFTLVTVYPVTTSQFAKMMSALTSEATSVESGVLDETDTILAKMNTDGSFSDVVYDSTHNASNHLKRIFALSQRWIDSTRHEHNDSRIYQSIVNGISFWNNKNLGNTNWYSRSIGYPNQYWRTIILMKDTLEVKNKPTLDSAVDYLTTSWKIAPSWQRTGANLADIAQGALVGSIIAEDSILCKQIVDSTISLLDWADYLAPTHRDGIYTDGGYSQHSSKGLQLYWGGYTEAFTSSLSLLMHTTYGTFAAYPFECYSKMEYVLLEGVRWGTVKSSIDFCATGRGNTRKGTVAGIGLRFIPIIKRLIADNTPRKSELSLWMSVINDSTHSTLIGTRQYNWFDGLITRTPTRYIAVHATSTRTVGPEKGNNEGLKNRYLASGATVYMSTGSEYADIMPLWNWYKTPGSTVVLNNSPFNEPDWGVAGGSGKVGGCSDGISGILLMEQKRDSIYGWRFWFSDTSCLLSVGRAISSTSTSQVVTTIDQTFCRSPVKTTGGNITLGSIYLNGLWRVICNGTLYASLSAEGSTLVTSEIRSGRWSDINKGQDTSLQVDTVLTITVEHGAQPSGSRYAYIVQPATAEVSLDSASELPVSLIVDSDTAMVARFNSGVWAHAFTKKAVCDSSVSLILAADTACAVLVRPISDDSLVVTVGALIRGTRALNIRLKGAWNGSGAVIDTATLSTLLAVKLPTGLYEGSSVVLGLKLIRNEQSLSINIDVDSIEYGDTVIAVSAQASSGLTTIDFSSSDTSILKFSGDSIRIVSVGSAIIMASQSGNSMWRPTTLEKRLTIYPRALEVIGTTVADRYYDGTNIAEVKDSGKLKAVRQGDSLTLSVGYGLFDSPSAGALKPVTAGGFKINGVDSFKYRLSGQPVIPPATIFPCSIMIKAENVTKYEGESDPVHFPITVYGLAAGETVSVLSDLTVSREPGETPGQYDISIGGSTNYNYLEFYTTGKMTIYPNEVISLPKKSKEKILTSVFPNPASIGEESMNFVVPTKGSGILSLSVYDVVGNCIATLFTEVTPTSQQSSIKWNLTNSYGGFVSKGMYLAILIFTPFVGSHQSETTIMVGVKDER